MTNTQSFSNIITSVPNGLVVTFCISVCVCVFVNVGVCVVSEGGGRGGG